MLTGYAGEQKEHVIPNATLWTCQLARRQVNTPQGLHDNARTKQEHNFSTEPNPNPNPYLNPRSITSRPSLTLTLTLTPTLTLTLGAQLLDRAIHRHEVERGAQRRRLARRPGAARARP